MDPSDAFWVKVGVSVVALIIIIVLAFNSYTKVSSGEVCLRTRGNAERGVMGPGYNWKVPMVEGKACFSTRLTTYEASLVGPEDSSSEADYVDYSVKAKTNEGVNFDQPFVIHYRLNKSQAEHIFNNVAKTDGRLKEKVKDLIRAEIPAVISTYSADELYLGNIDTISAEVAGRLAPSLETLGVELVYFKLKKGDFEDYYEQAIADKALQVEVAEKKKLEQDVAREEAERLRIEAEGQATATRIQAQGQADATVTQAEADAAALELRADAINDNPSLIEWERIQAIRDADAIYLPADVLPILPIGVGPTTP